MRLIDADKLDLVVHVPSQNNAVCQQIADEVGRQIVNAPTVKAIPVEWIKKYAKKGGKIANILFPFEIEIMLEDWEKENE